MPEEEKPYRVYRGGRTKGRVPLASPRSPRDAPRDTPHYGSGRPGASREERRPRRSRGWRDRNWRRIIILTVLLLFVLLVAWAVTSFFAFRTGVHAANKRLGRGTRSALVHQNGLLLSKPTNILLLGTDHSKQGGRGGCATPTPSSCSAPIPSTTSSSTCRSSVTSGWTFPATGSRRSTPRISSAAPGLRSRRYARSPACRSTTS